MIKKTKKIVWHLFFYGLFFITLSVLDAQFKTYWPGKVVHLSTSSGKLLKKMMPKFQKLSQEKNKITSQQNSVLFSYRNKMVDMLGCFSVANPICGEDIESLGEFIFKARAPLIMILQSGVRGNQINLSYKLIKEIGFDLSQTLKEVYIGTAKADLKQIREFLNNPKNDQIIFIYGLIQEIIQHFDGVAITEFDFMVLCQCALFVLFVAS